MVSRICEIIDTDLDGIWEKSSVESAVKQILSEINPNFDDLIKNLEGNLQLYKYVHSILVDGATYTYNIDNTVIQLGKRFGILTNQDGIVGLQNYIYAQRIYSYMKLKSAMERLFQNGPEPALAL